MSRIKLKCGGKRRKALFGADGAIMAAATLGAAALTTAATAKAAKEQSNAIIDNATQQADVLKQTNENNTQLQKQSIEFTKQQNAEIRNQQKDIQTTLQMLAGQQNMNSFNERNKMQVKYGGSKRTKLKSSLPYGGGQQLFTVTDGGGVIPLDTDSQGYGLYEIYGNDHEHYHKTRGGKTKTGVGIKFSNGEVIEGEGNQNSSQGELMYVTPNDAMFISKHNIDGFNPTKAVLTGMNPEDAFNTQEYIKYMNGYNDDGTKAKCGKRKKLKAMMGIDIPINSITANLINTNNINDNITGAAYIVKQDNNSSPVAKCGKRVSLRRKASLGTFFNSPYWQNYGGATINTAGNLLGAGLSWIGNSIAANKLGNAYNKAGNILADAYSNLSGIDMNLINKEDYESNTNAIAAIRDANYRNNAMRERVRRDRIAQERAINDNTISSAARQIRLASTADRYNQRINELAEQEANINENIRQGNMERITNVSAQNADRKAQSIRDYTNARLALAQYNNDIANQRITGAAQSISDAITQSAGIRANSLMTSMNAIGNAIANSGNAFATAYDDIRSEKRDFTNTYIGLGNEKQIDAAIIRAEQTGDNSFLQAKLASLEGKNDRISNRQREAIEYYLTYGRRKPDTTTNITQDDIVQAATNAFLLYPFK